MSLTPNDVHIDSLSEKRKRRRAMTDDESLQKATLSTEEREKLSDSDFALPGRRYPIHNPEHARVALSRVAQNGDSEEQAKVRAAVKGRYPNIEVSKVDLICDLWKSDEKHVVYGVVLTPEWRDSQDDVVSKAQIEEAAHRYLRESRKHDVQHDDVRAPVEPVESYIAPHDMIVAGKLVKGGSWVLAAKVHDEAIWKRVSDPEHPEPLTGFSIGGSAVRVPETA